MGNIVNHPSTLPPFQPPKKQITFLTRTALKTVQTSSKNLMVHRKKESSNVQK